VPANAPELRQKEPQSRRSSSTRAGIENPFLTYARPRLVQRLVRQQLTSKCLLIVNTFVGTLRANHDDGGTAGS
jgi:hypothetical protein